MAEPFFIKNREKLFSKLEDNSTAVLFAGNAPTKRGEMKNTLFTRQKFLLREWCRRTKLYIIFC